MSHFSHLCMHMAARAYANKLDSFLEESLISRFNVL